LRRLRISPLQGDSHFPNNSHHVDQAEVSDPVGKIKNAKVSKGKAGSKKQVELVQCIFNNA